ncbi:MAG: zinc-ribbon domain-containing protein [Desulfobacterales bacterium]
MKPLLTKIFNFSQGKTSQIANWQIERANMPKASEQYNLHIINPELAMEWHPTRNGDLNPRIVTPGSGKKVWWICADGHEWKAAIYSRNRGSGCPFCNKPTSVDHSDMLITDTDLVKEWHLTKNSGLNLRNLPPGFNQKVWWICEQGHEWKATVKSRMKGNDCPDCNKYLRTKTQFRVKKSSRLGQKISSIGTGSVQLDDALQSSDSQLSAATGFRKSRRYRHRATVILEEAKSGALSYAQTKDFSNDGMLLESEVAFKPGTRINIQFDNPPFKSTLNIYKSTVKWCKELGDEDSVLTYGIGIKFI